MVNEDHLVLSGTMGRYGARRVCLSGMHAGRGGDTCHTGSRCDISAFTDFATDNSAVGHAVAPAYSRRGGDANACADKNRRANAPAQPHS